MNVISLGSPPLRVHTICWNRQVDETPRRLVEYLRGWRINELPRQGNVNAASGLEDRSRREAQVRRDRDVAVDEVGSWRHQQVGRGTVRQERSADEVGQRLEPAD